ncbi:MAG: hypothetical protein F6K14_25735 [Symploca sp. SIO2C1]|nr:hypothetical protein [Symploca sp. SIO2C1]
MLCYTSVIPEIQKLKKQGFGSVRDFHCYAESDRIGISIDGSEQLYPEQTTTAFVTYHPVTRYFSA